MSGDLNDDPGVGGDQGIMFGYEEDACLATDALDGHTFGKEIARMVVPQRQDSSMIR